MPAAGPSPDYYRKMSQKARIFAGFTYPSSSTGGSITAAAAGVPTPYFPVLATASYVATVVGFGADASGQVVKPDVDQYSLSGVTNLVSGSLSDKYPGLASAINETSNAVNSSTAGTNVKNSINNYWNSFANYWSSSK